MIECLVVEVADTRRVVRCSMCGFKTDRVHDRRRLKIHDLPTGGRATTLMWIRRRFTCDNCDERFCEDHPEIVVGRRTHVTRRLARQLVRDVNAMSIREVARRYDLPWQYIMTLTGGWSGSSPPSVVDAVAGSCWSMKRRCAGATGMSRC